MDNTGNQNLDQVRTILRYTYGLVPIVAGLDKFTHLLTNWNQYLHPFISQIIDPQIFMYIVGVIEIVAGIIVLTKPRLGGFIVMAWLIGIALNLIFTGKYFDIAVRDLVMAIGAYSLAKLYEISGYEVVKPANRMAEPVKMK